MPQLVERKLTTDELKEFAHFSEMGLKLLNINQKESSPEMIVDAVDKYVDKWQKQQRNLLSRTFVKKPDTRTLLLWLLAQR